MLAPTIHEVIIGKDRYGVVFDHFLVSNTSVDATVRQQHVPDEKESWNESCMIFLDASYVISEAVFLTGVYHAIKDRTIHGSNITPVLAIDVCLHVFCTRQVDLIRDFTWPGFPKDTFLENHEIMVVHVFPEANQDAALENRSRLLARAPVTLEGSRSSFSLDDPATLRLLQHYYQIEEKQARQLGIEGVARVIKTKMALFSLQVQSKPTGTR